MDSIKGEATKKCTCQCFRSRNVFLRITDGKKYCYYGVYAWLCTITLGSLAMFAHFTMDYPDLSLSMIKNNIEKPREQIGLYYFELIIVFLMRNTLQVPLV